jgi:exopolysaccharide biosynthesis protein
LTIKDGVLISKGEPSRGDLIGTTGADRAFFGITKDGKPVIAMESEYTENEAKLQTLQTAIGGNLILAKDGKTVYYKSELIIDHGRPAIGPNGEKIFAPRTVFGYREDGSVVLMVVDGRQPTHSNGATLMQLSMLLHRFGVSDALQLDGGGSSCIVLRDPETNVYTTVDKPSDGHLRKVYNSLLVVKKEEN